MTHPGRRQLRLDQENPVSTGRIGARRRFGPAAGGRRGSRKGRTAVRLRTSAWRIERIGPRTAWSCKWPSRRCVAPPGMARSWPRRARAGGARSGCKGLHRCGFAGACGNGPGPDGVCQAAIFGRMQDPPRGLCGSACARRGGLVRRSRRTTDGPAREGIDRIFRIARAPAGPRPVGGRAGIRPCAPRDP